MSEFISPTQLQARKNPLNVLATRTTRRRRCRQTLPEQLDPIYKGFDETSPTIRAVLLVDETNTLQLPQ